MITTVSATTSTTTTTEGGLVTSPTYIADKTSTCIQNSDVGKEDAIRFDIDLSLEVGDRKSADAYMSAAAKWMEIITGILSSV